MKTLRAILFVAGILALLYGCWAWWQPLAWILGGVTVASGSVLWAAVEQRRVKR